MMSESAIPSPLGAFGVGDSQGKDPRSRDQEGAKKDSWAAKVGGGSNQKRKMQMIYHQPDFSEDLIMVMLP